MKTYEEKVDELNRIFASQGLQPIGSDLGFESHYNPDQTFIIVGNSSEIDSDFDFHSAVETHAELE